METIKKAIQYIGGAYKLGRLLGVRMDQPQKWIKNICFPSTKNALKIEVLTKGHIKSSDILMEKMNIKLEKERAKND